MKLQFVSEDIPPGAYSTKEIEKAEHPKISLPGDVAVFFGGFFDRKKQEYFCVLNLDGGNQVISARIVTIGLLNHSLVHPREVFKDAILDSAAAIIAVHNHPSGTLEPSSQDISITRQLKDAGEIIGVKLLDHIIITPGGAWFSLRERGLM
jgi:DNA repair protein RadC